MSDGLFEAPSSGGLASLPEELLNRILGYLLPPYVTLKRPDIVNAALTSKMFHAIAIPLIWHSILVSNSFLKNLHGLLELEHTRHYAWHIREFIFASRNFWEEHSILSRKRGAETFRMIREILDLAVGVEKVELRLFYASGSKQLPPRIRLPPGKVLREPIATRRQFYLDTFCHEFQELLRVLATRSTIKEVYIEFIAINHPPKPGRSEIDFVLPVEDSILEALYPKFTQYNYIQAAFIPLIFPHSDVVRFPNLRRLAALIPDVANSTIEHIIQYPSSLKELHIDPDPTTWNHTRAKFSHDAVPKSYWRRDDLFSQISMLQYDLLPCGLSTLGLRKLVIPVEGLEFILIKLPQLKRLAIEECVVRSGDMVRANAIGSVSLPRLKECWIWMSEATIRHDGGVGSYNLEACGFDELAKRILWSCRESLVKFQYGNWIDDDVLRVLAEAGCNSLQIAELSMSWGYSIQGLLHLRQCRQLRWLCVNTAGLDGGAHELKNFARVLFEECPRLKNIEFENFGMKHGMTLNRRTPRGSFKRGADGDIIIEEAAPNFPSEPGLIGDNGTTCTIQ